MTGFPALPAAILSRRRAVGTAASLKALPAACGLRALARHHFFPHVRKRNSGTITFTKQPKPHLKRVFRNIESGKIMYVPKTLRAKRGKAG